MSPILLPQKIRAMPLFSGLAEKEKDALLKEGKLRQHDRGQALFFHGDPVTHFYIIAHGDVQIYRENMDGKEKTIAILNAGHTIGESDILDACLHHRVNALSITDVTVMEFDVAWLKDAARKHSVFALNLLALVSEHAHMAQIEAEHQATMSASQLVACFIQRLCILYGFNPTGFELPYSKTLIASRLGMELETFSRALAKLKSYGIQVTGTHVSITDFESVEQFVCGFCSIANDCQAHQAMTKKRQCNKISENR